MRVSRSASITASLIAVGFGLPALGTEVAVCTDLGPVTLELFDEQTPLHVANFLEYVDQGFYSGTVFHRVIDGFMIQGGGYDRQLREKTTRSPVANESRNGPSNMRGTLAAARTNDPHSAAAQFYINLVDNPRLDGTEQDFGYTVFGRVVDGMDLVDQMGSLPTRGAGPFPTDVPRPLVGVDSIARLDRSVVETWPADERAGALRDSIAAAAENPSETLSWIGHYRASCAGMDAELLLTEARAAAALLRTPRAKAVLDEYFALVTDEAEGYAEALELYAHVAPGVAPETVARFGQCEAAELPQVPDGEFAPMQEMVEGQAAVREFMEQSDGYLDCLSEIIDEEDLSDEQHARVVREHNRMVTLMEQLAEDFNAQVRTFREREGQ